MHLSGNHITLATDSASCAPGGACYYFYMSSHNIAQYKEKLEEELKTLKGELKAIGRQNPENPNDWEATEKSMDVMTPMADPNESADKIEEYNENRAIVDELEIRYNNVKRALKKIEDGTYGRCEAGGEEIEVPRLAANPSARTCLKHMAEEKGL